MILLIWMAISMSSYLGAQEVLMELNPLINIGEAPSLQETYTMCQSKSEDKLKACQVYLMINAYERQQLDSIHHHFGRFLNASRTEKLSRFEISAVFRYASYLEVIGENELAGKYYRYLAATLLDDSYYGVLSKIGQIGLTNNVKAIEKIQLTLDEKVNNLSADEVAVILLKLISYLNYDETFLLLDRFHDIKDEILNVDVRVNFLGALFYSSSITRQNSAKELFVEFKQSSFLNKSSANKNVVLTQKLQYSLMKGEYSNALEIAKQRVLESIGNYENIDSMLRIYDESTRKPYFQLVGFAQAKLYQTRLGAGIEPVKEAYQIYSHLYRSELFEKIKKIRRLTTERNRGIGPYYQNLLIVGNYLHANTGEEKYLDESVSVLDGYAGAGTFFWAQARERMRHDAEFSEALTEILTREAALRAATNQLSLREIFDQDQELRNLRERFLIRFADFYTALEQDNQLTLADLREELAADSAGVVCFYANEVILYRLFVSADTTEMRMLDRDLAQARKLTRLLASQAPNPNQDQAELQETSHQLYNILFAGLDSLLPPKLHVVATDELIDVPYAALRISAPEEPAKFLGVEHALSRQFSLGSMRALASQERHPRYPQPLAMAPSFAGELLAASELRQAGFTLNPLAYNEEEVQQLENRGAGKYLYGKRATIDRYRRAAADYGIIHLASHAISSQVDGIRSRVYLLDGGGEPEALFAADLENTTLDAELVVLSACETGGGARNAVEGRVGLTKAYLGAGARAVVASSWAVDDYATAEIMDGFYDATANGITPHEALRRARASYLSNHPDAPVANWAAFEAYGGMVAPQWNQAGGRNWWLWGGGLAALFGLGLGWSSLRRAA